jgi:uncharacterized protein
LPHSKAILATVILLLFCLVQIPIAHAEDPVNLHYYVTDSAGVLGYTETLRIQDQIIAIENDTSAQVAVYVVNTTGTMTIDQFAVQTFQMSQLGQKGVDNGLLLVVAVNDHHWKFEIGYGLEGVLNDAKVGNIGRTYLDPAFKLGDYGGGIYDAVHAVGLEILNSNVGQPSHQYPILGIPLNWWQLVLAAIVLVALVIITKGGVFVWIGGLFGRGGGGKSGGGGAEGKW